ncbi:secreted and transmembrane protein 1 isoform X2 [Myotis myotis]|uniref:Secreted and transmembrane 1 n=1 Tax=Myotis myotis TaxID=51298 RepID=A0A7J7R4A1_MYOMY|nr:secreted and transmembrane protein 1 isoform X2 [Myotis myotis]KAF6270883.1 secreted and transmembrane 1 [Myotis myotis]
MLLWALLLTLTSQGAGAGDPPELPSMPPWGRCPFPELQSRGRAVGERAEAQQWPPVNVTTPGWDHPVCTEGVSVTRGAPAEMTCNSSNPIRKVSICLQAPGGEDCHPIFTQATPGCSSRGGWKLCVQGCSAKMVTEGAQDSQAGQYMWTLRGRQTELKSTTLNVSEPSELPSMPPWGTQDPLLAQDPLPAQDLRSAQDPPPGRLHVALILVPMLLCVLALGGLQFWRRSRGRPSHFQFL